MKTKLSSSIAILCSSSSVSIVYGFQPFSFVCNRRLGRTNSYLQTDPDDSTNNSGRNNPSYPDKEVEDTTTNDIDIDSLLDQPLFDPDKSNNWFANLVRNDYNTAEALYAGIIIALGVIAAQEALRVVKYGGSGYIPFHGSGGQLF